MSQKLNSPITFLKNAKTSNSARLSITSFGKIVASVSTGKSRGLR